MLVQESHDEIIHHEQGSRSNHAAGHRVVVADDRVLHRIRKGQQNDQVKRI